MKYAADLNSVEEKELLMQAVLEADHDIDASLGTVIRELGVRPAAQTAAVVDATLAEFKKTMTLSTALSSEKTDSEWVDALAGNLGLSRETGVNPSGMVSLFCPSPANVYISSGTVFSGGGLDLICSKTYIGYFSDQRPGQDSEELAYRKMTETAAGWVFSIPVTSIEATASSLPVGQPMVMNPSNKDVDSVLVSSAVSGGRDPETDEALLKRASEGPVAAVPSGKTHIEALLRDGVPDVPVLFSRVFGMGDPEMLRDRGNPISVSMGGRVDVYAQTRHIPTTVEITLAVERLAGERWRLVVDRAAAPGFYQVESVAALDDDTPVENLSVAFGMDVPESEPVDIQNSVQARLSSYQTAVLTFDWGTDSVLAQSFVLKLSAMPGLDVIQNYMNAPDVRNRAYDVVVKAPPACFLSVSMTVTYPPGTRETLGDDVKAAVSKAVNELDIGQQYITADDIVGAVNSVDGSYRVDFPINMRLTTVKADGSSESVETATGRVDAITDVDNGVTDRNTCFICRTTDVTVVFRERSSIT